LVDEAAICIDLGAGDAIEETGVGGVVAIEGAGDLGVGADGIAAECGAVLLDGIAHGLDGDVDLERGGRGGGG